LWSLCLLSAFAVMLGYRVRQKAILLKRLDERARVSFLAGAGAGKAASELKKRQLADPQYAALNETWSNNEAAFRGIATGGGTVDVCYDYVDERSGGAQTRYGLIDEESKINLNNIGSDNKEEALDVLRRLFMAVLGYDEARAQELAASIIDWRDSDSGTSLAFGSAEEQYYSGLAYPYKPRNAALEIPEELLLVKGIDENVFSKIRNYVTIYGTGRVNANTASKAVLASLGLSEDIVDALINFRAGEDGLTGTADDNVFRQASEIVPALSAAVHLSSSEVAQLSSVASRHLGVTSKKFSAFFRVKLNNSRDVSWIYCVMDNNGKILHWREP